MTTLALLSLVLTTAALFGWFSTRVLRVPITLGTMLLTVVSSLSLSILSGHLPALHAWAVALVARIHFEGLILHGMLGLLLFAGAFLLDLAYLAQEKLAVGILSAIGTPLSAIAVAAWMHWTLALLGIPTPWIECLLFGALISPTDPIAVLEMLRRVGVPKNIEAQLAGESLFNDGVGAVLFLAVLDASHGAAPSALHVGRLLLVQSGGGLLLGIVLAWIVAQLMRRAAAYQIEILLTLSLALGGYSLAESLHLSAPLEAVAAGLALRHFSLDGDAEALPRKRLDTFWEAIDEVQNAILFVLLGLQVLVIQFSAHHVESGLLAIFGVLATRTLMVTALLGLVRLLQRGHATSALTLSWGGLRGGLSIALALSLPAAQGRSWMVATTYFVVVFSILVQGGTLSMLFRRFGNVTQPADSTQPA